MANHSIEPGQMCLGCGANPATSTDGTVPLCSQCATLAKGNKRGVKYEKPDEITPPIQN